MARFSGIAKKLQGAINSRPGAKISINTQQWYSKDKGRPITIYIIKQAFESDGYKKTTELFKTYSQVQMVLFLRDYWYELNGWEVPTDNEAWEEAKQKYGQSGLSAWDTKGKTTS